MQLIFIIIYQFNNFLILFCFPRFPFSSFTTYTTRYISKYGFSLTPSLCGNVSKYGPEKNSIFGHLSSSPWILVQGQDLRFCTDVQKHGSQNNRVLAYFTQCSLLSHLEFLRANIWICVLAYEVFPFLFNLLGHLFYLHTWLLLLF